MYIVCASFEINGITYFTSANGNNGTTTFDGGERGWSRMSLDVGSHTANSITFVVFDRVGRNGFPGNAGSSLTHSVFPYEWRISYGVTPSRTSDPVPINLSHQTYWNLDGFGANSSGTIAKHTLHLPFSGLRLDENEHGIPTGDIKGNTKKSCHDFWSESKLLGDCPKEKGKYNDLYLISRQSPWEKDSKPVASLSSAKTGIRVDMYTDQEAIRLLTWDGGPHCKFAPDSGLETIANALSDSQSDA
jgi:aldose 1-epimerase